MSASGIQQTISSCKALKKLNKELEKNKKNEERAEEIEKEYIEILEYIIEADANFNSISITDNITKFRNELTELDKGTYHGLSKKNTFKDFILQIIEWTKDWQSKVTFKRFETLITTLRWNKHSKYFPRTLVDNPMCLIEIINPTITFNQAYRISKELKIHISDKTLMQKWAIYVLKDNGGSFYKIKSRKESEFKYDDFKTKSFNGWYNCLYKFCNENNLRNNYGKYIRILDGLLIEHSNHKHLYGIKEYIELEKQIGQELLDLYYEQEEEEEYPEYFNNFIHECEIQKQIGCSYSSLSQLKSHL